MLLCASSSVDGLLDWSEASLGALQCDTSILYRTYAVDGRRPRDLACGSQKRPSTSGSRDKLETLEADGSTVCCIVGELGRLQPASDSLR
ncbi:unnamed protein product [Parajaminaea phylloscopi]